MRVIGVLAATLVAAAGAAAQQLRVPVDSLSPPATAVGDVTRANELFGTIMSPFCPGLTLANCPSTYAETLRVSIRARLEAGEQQDAVMESMVAAFGEGVRGAPRARGLGLVLWTLPFITLVVGATGVTWWLRRRGAPPAAPRAPVSRVAAAVASPEELERLVTALRDYE